MSRPPQAAGQMSRPRRAPGLKLSGKMILFFVALVLCQSFVTLTILTVIVSRTNLDSLKSQMKDTLASADGYLAETLRDLRVKGDLIAGQQKTVDYTDFGLRNLLARELEVFRESLGIESIAVFLPPDGSLFAQTGPAGNGGLLSREGLAGALQGRKELRLSQARTGTILFILSPIRRADRILGVLSLGLRVDPQLVQRIQKIINARVVLRFGDTTVHDGSLPETRILRIIDSWSRQAAGASSTVSSGEFVVGALDLTSLGLEAGTLYCLMDTAESTRQLRRYNLVSLLATCLVLTLALATGIVFYRRTFHTRFQRILQGITRISRGDFRPPFELQWQDEFGQMALAFDDMCRKLLAREKQLSQLSRYNTLVLDSVRSGIVTVSLDGEITAFNPAARSLLSCGGASLLGTRLEAGIVPRDLLPVFNEALAQSAYASGREVIVPSAEGATVLAVSSSPLLSPDGERIGIIVVFEDITREKSLEEKLALSTKLAALGEMAAGVAHQVRNPLVVMKVSTEMLRDNFTVSKDTEKYRKLTRLIVDEIEGLDLVISNFLDFARPRRLQRAPVALHSVVSFALDSLPLDRFPGIKVRVSVPEDLPEHPMDRTLMAQALANLILNGLQASGAGGYVDVRARGEDGKLRIEVEDGGAGMDDETQRSIFNPFFSTRDSGTGLGLSIVHRIVESHGGTIDVRSRPGAGATFSILV